MEKSLTLTQFRRKMCLSQEDFGKFLRTTRTQISMAEKGQRPLTGKATDRLGKFQALLRSSALIPTNAHFLSSETKESDHTKQIKFLQQILSTNKWQRFAKGAQLKKMQEGYSNLKITCNSICLLINFLTTHNGAPQEIDFFKDRLRYTTDRMMLWNDFAQLKLTIEIDLLTAEASVIIQYLEAATAAPGVPM